jgi:hypothetical protein
VNKNWPNDVGVGCKNLFNLVEFMKIEVDLKGGLGVFERSFEQDKMEKNFIYIYIYIMHCLKLYSANNDSHLGD